MAGQTAQQTLTPPDATGMNVTFEVFGESKADQLPVQAMLPVLGQEFTGMGRVDERQIPFLPPTRADSDASTHGGNIAHIYQPTRGNPGWGKTQAWGLAGYDPSISEYDRNFGTSENDFHTSVTAGFKRLFSKLPLSAPTMTREGRVSAQHNTLPAARFFQSYTGSGTGHNWSGATNAQGQRSLRVGWNPHMQGAAEPMPAMTYDPFPSPATLYPKVV